MSKLRSLNTSIWGDVWFENLSKEEKLLFLYLILNDKTNMLGAYEISLKKISFETSISIEVIKNGIAFFEKENKILYKNNRIILLNYLKHQNYNNNMKISAIDVYNELPKELKINGYDSLERNSKGFLTLCQGFETLSKGLGMVTKPLETIRQPFERVSKVEVEYEVEVETEVEKEKEIETEPKKKSSEIFQISKEENFSNDVIISEEKEKKEKVAPKRKIEFSELIEDCYLECLRHFPDHLHPKTPSGVKTWKITIKELHEKDLIPLEVIIKTVKAVRADAFWKENFLSLNKLRKNNPDGVKYIVVFNEKFNGKSINKSNEQIFAESRSRFAGMGINFK